VLQVPESAPNEFLTAEQFRRNCGVVFRSKRTIVVVGSEGGDQLAQTGAERAFAAHDFLREPAQVIGGGGAKGEEVPDLRILGSAGLHFADEIGMRAGLRVVLHAGEKHGFHDVSPPAEARFWACMSEGI